MPPGVTVRTFGPGCRGLRVTSKDSSLPDAPGASRPAGNGLAESVAGMSDAELRGLASAVLAELRARSNDPSSEGFSYHNLVSDLRRRLADAHAYAQSGFGHRHKPLTKFAPGTSAPLSEEKKAMLLTGLEAELLSEHASSAPAAFVELPAGWDSPGGQGDDGEPPAQEAPSEPASSIEADIWEALQIEVGRTVATPPAKQGEPGEDSAQ